MSQGREGGGGSDRADGHRGLVQLLRRNFVHSKRRWPESQLKRSRSER